MKRGREAVFFEGPPGCGKGTQHSLFVKTHGHIGIGMSTIMRERMEYDAELRIAAERAFATGQLLDDVRTIEVLRHRLNMQHVLTATHVAIEGAPRTARQAEFCAHHFTSYDYTIILISIEVSNEACNLRRLNRIRVAKEAEDTPRADDAEHLFLDRLGIYHSNHRSLVEVMRLKKAFVLPINGEGTIEEVEKRIQAAYNEVHL